VRRFAGLVWRHVPVGAEPLHLGWILKAARGRWNSRRPRLPCVYTALTPQGAVAEFEKHVAAYGAPGRRRDLVSLRVSVGPVLDLTRSRVVRALDVDPAVLTGDRPSDLAACREVARWAVFDRDYRAILAPSAALAGGVNLMIYLESTRRLALANGPDRVTFGAGYRWPEA
jgi:RES domain-containing protein